MNLPLKLPRSCNPLAVLCLFCIALIGCQLEELETTAPATSTQSIDPNSRTDGSLIVRMQANKLSNLNISVFEYWPQIFLDGRGYSFEGVILQQGSNFFGPITTELARNDLVTAARHTCSFLGSKKSRFFNLSKNEPGRDRHRILFNCF